MSARTWKRTLIVATLATVLASCAGDEAGVSRLDTLLGGLGAGDGATRTANAAGGWSGVPGATSGTGRTGSGVFLGAGNPPIRREPTFGGDEGFQLNLVDAPIPAAAQFILGDTLDLNYVVDPDLPGTITLQTSSPVSREALIDIFEITLAANGYAIVENADIYRIVQSNAAIANTPPVSVPALQASAPGMRVLAVPLAYIAAEEMRDILTPISQPGSILRFDSVRNYLLLAGSQAELSSMLDAISVFDVDWMRGKSVALHPLKDAAPQAVASQLEEIFRSSDGATADVIRFVPNEQLGSILVVTSQPHYLPRASEWIRKLDTIGGAGSDRLFVYPVQNRPAEELARVLQSVLGGGSDGAVSPGLGEVEVASADGVDPTFVGLTADPDLGASVSSSVVADTENNSLLISATAEEYRRLEPVLRRLDTVATQVMLEAVIVEVSLNDTLRFGVRWFLENGSATRGFDSALEPNFPGFSWNSALGDFRSTINALSSVTDVNVISTPTLMALNNQEAILQIGDQVPVVTRTAESADDPDARIVSAVELRDTGIILNVVPRVNAHGGVLLDIDQEASRVVATTSSGIDSPTIQQRRLRTRVSVMDGESVVLGGLIQEGTQRTKNGVPVLSDVPVVGNLFRDRRDRRERTELLIFVRPQIIRDAHAARRVSDEFRQRLDFGRSETPQQRRQRDLRRLR
ncbi:secretin N-terminal domain-containing protein [uncultured Jannaschia sp.]|uniref:secretin N-terminal domain-containing protein n=1 Tax=uncultured Jannaschia sp. TaxID=293347 RepID=UPI002627DEE0|nr:secretin N-terminal domain-containing protein [uncultured Jannaschia sp.]